MTKDLSHYGVLGMKWGTRRARSKSSSEVRKLRKKKAYELTDEELKKVANRLDLEKRYKQVTKSSAAKGRDATGKILATAAGGVLAAGTTAAFTAIGKKVIEYAKTVYVVGKTTGG